ncbi:MAG TPA: hypothetical protein VMY88_11890 [Acidimicrobiales bacterium]|nr:hypothetical protein [Acidimicrobiales bacterium]
MGYRGKVAEQNRARDLRADGTLFEIAEELGVAKSSVSLWVRDVPFVARRPNYRRWEPGRPPTGPMRRKQEEIRRLTAEGLERIGQMTERDFFIAGTALYAGEGAKTDGDVKFTNTNPQMVLFFCTWLRRFWGVDESRLRLRLYLHEGLDLEAAERFWSDLTRIPRNQFGKAYRAVPDASIRVSKHPMGCPSVTYNCTRTHRSIMGLVGALLSCEAFPG